MISYGNVNLRLFRLLILFLAQTLFFFANHALLFLGDLVWVTDNPYHKYFFIIAIIIIIVVALLTPERKWESQRLMK